MRNRLIIDGNGVYEIDDECVKRKQGRNPGGNRENPLAAPGQEKNQRR